MKNFIKYAKHYNSFYRGKDYKKEVNYVDGLIKRYSRLPNKMVLDIGCGTGNHDLWLARKGYRVTGIDKSGEMIAIAREKNAVDNGTAFYVSDVLKLNLNKKFDVAISLFHVMSYLTTNEVIVKSLQNIHRHLKNSGLFIFDFWYGPAVLTQRPKPKTKIVYDGDKIIERAAMPKIDINADTVDVHYKINIRNKNGNREKGLDEHHIMRYFFLPELYLLLEIAGFKLIKCLNWMSDKDCPNENSWSGTLIARK